MDSARDFEQVYASELKPALLSLESRRKRVLRDGLFTFIPAAISITGLIIFFTSDRLLPSYIYIVSLLVLTVAVYFGIRCYNGNKDYLAAFKQLVMFAVVKAVDPDLIYKPFESVSEADYKKSGLFKDNYDRFRGDDLIQGLRDKTVFCFSELHTEEEVKRGKSSSWETIFRGIFFIADFNKDFHGRTYVWNDHDSKLNPLSNIFSSFDDGLEKIVLESTEFESAFKVYSSDQVEARYILTPSMMERMLRLRNELNTPVTYSFVDTNIYVAVPFTTELFEPSLFAETGKNKLKGYYETVRAIISIVDELELNTRIWTKQ